MAYDKVVDSSALDNIFLEIANAIRNKNGLTTKYTPSEMALAIDAIDSDSGGNNDELLKSLIDKSITNIELPFGITSIGDYAFYDCTNLALTELPSSVTSIGSYAFMSCSKLKTLTFKGIPTSIDSTAFSNCKNLTNIYVPWSNNAVANAPWGATNATIHYNS